MLVPARLLLLPCLLAPAAGCEKPAKSDFSFYEERIAPVLDVGCQRQTTGCHVDDGNGFALGNLDLSSYESLIKRHDVLEPYGPYSVGLLLLKAGDPIRVQVETVDPPDPAQPDRRYVTVTTDIRHGGGEGAIAEGSEDYAILKRWIDSGHTRSGVPAGEFGESMGRCTGGPGALEGLDLGADPADMRSYSAFVTDVQPVLSERCSGSHCHGTKTADLYLSCGDTDAERRWNYEVVLRHLNEQAVASELLRRPLAMRAGGSYHEGGDVFENTDDPDYQVVLEWIEDVAERRPELLRYQPEDAGVRFFINRVQPVLVRKGCMFLGCHSPAMFHDLRLRGGSRGDFSEIAVRRNYEMSRLMLAIESPDPNASRLIAKNLCPPESGGRGVKHRGGALFEDFGGCARVETRASAALCEGVDVDQGDLNEIPAYCVLAGWHALERELAVARGEFFASGPSGVVFVSRARAFATPTAFDTYAPSADLLWADAAAGPQGELMLGAPRSLLASCGLGGDPDVRGPAISWDGTRIAFAARSSADAPLRIYELNADGTGCAVVGALAAADDSQDGILLHDFDPAYAPDGQVVFASTRGNLNGAGNYRGPTRTPAELQPNANLYVFDPATSEVRQLTYLLDQELQPSFMADGRVIFTAQKRGEGFHQLAGRRINLDGGDYHPLFAQRSSVGFESATEIVELPNRDLAMVAAPLFAHNGAGAIVVVNRSIGPDQDDRDPSDRAYVHSLTMAAEGAFGGSSGVFRSPSPLPSGRILASCDLDSGDLGAAEHAFGLCELDPSGHDEPRLLYAAELGRMAIEAVAVYARPAVEVFRSRTDEVNGSSTVDPGGGDAIVHYLDVPLLGTLLFSNTREGRPIDSRVAGIKLYEVQPPPAGAMSFDALGDAVVEDGFGRFYEALRSLGDARLRADGSLRVRVPSGMPISLALTDAEGDVLPARDGAPLPGPLRQREAMQFYPGERLKQSMTRKLFDGVCAGCHGSVSGRELDVGVSIDVLTSASMTAASDDLVELR